MGRIAFSGLEYGTLRNSDMRNGFYYNHCITCEKELPKAKEPRRCKLCLKAHMVSLRKVMEPTNAPPGSEEKIKVMQERSEKGVPIFNPLDKTLWENNSPPEEKKMRKGMKVEDYDRLELE